MHGLLERWGNTGSLVGDIKTGYSPVSKMAGWDICDKNMEVYSWEQLADHSAKYFPLVNSPNYFQWEDSRFYRLGHGFKFAHRSHYQRVWLPLPSPPAPSAPSAPPGHVRVGRCALSGAGGLGSSSCGWTVSLQIPSRTG